MLSAADSDFAEGDEGKRARQSTDVVLMVSPTGFEFNPEAANDNAFMSGVDVKDHDADDDIGQQHPTESDLTATALHEFHGLYRMLTETVGIQVSHRISVLVSIACFLGRSICLSKIHWNRHQMLSFRTTG